ncbi:MAG: CotY/CotZ family spore coat protein [Bacilli bacterium]
MCNDCKVNCKCNCNCDSCIADILQTICNIQTNVNNECCLNCCDRPVLGCGETCTCCNTRPIMIYCGCCSTPWSVPTTKTNANCSTTPADCTSVFRLEKINNCCATFRALAPCAEEGTVYPYVATDSVFTMNINCICALRCLNDTYVDCV